MWALAQLLRVRALHRMPFTFGSVAKRPIPPDIVDSYLLPSRRDPAVRRDLRRFLRGVHHRYTLAAAQALPQFTKPCCWLGQPKTACSPSSWPIGWPACFHKRDW